MVQKTANISMDSQQLNGLIDNRLVITSVAIELDWGGLLTSLV